MRAPWSSWHRVRGELSRQCHRHIPHAVSSAMGSPEQRGSAVLPHTAAASRRRHGEALDEFFPCLGHLLGFLVPGRIVHPTAIHNVGCGSSAVPLLLSTEGAALGLLLDSPGARRLLRSDTSTGHHGLCHPCALDVLRSLTPLWAEHGGSWLVSAGGSVLGTNNKHP